MLGAAASTRNARGEIIMEDKKTVAEQEIEDKIERQEGLREQIILDSKTTNPQDKHMASGMAMGMVIGVASGALLGLIVFGDMILGMLLGISVGMIIGLIIGVNKKKK